MEPLAATESVREESCDALEWLGRSLLPEFGHAAAIVLFAPPRIVCEAVGVHVDGRLSDAVRSVALRLAQSGDPPLHETVAAHGSLCVHTDDDVLAFDVDVAHRLAAI